MSKLTPKQEAFAQAVADGNTQADAYRIAFDVKPSTKPETVQANASRLMADSMVSARVAELRSNLAEKALWTREDSVRRLRDIALGGAETKDSDSVSAIKELNSMHGWNSPQKIDHTSSDRSMSPKGIDPNKLSTAALAELLAAADESPAD
jgi:phage terminase small subunit